MHLYARLHALRMALFRPREVDIAREVYDRAAKLMKARRLDTAEARQRLTVSIARNVCTAHHVGSDAVEADVVLTLVRDLLDDEHMFTLRDVDWSVPRSISELWELRAEFQAQLRLLDTYDDVVQTLTRFTSNVVRIVHMPEYTGTNEPDGITVPSRKLDLLGDVPDRIEAILGTAFDQRLIALDLLSRMRAQLEANLIIASGGNPSDPRSAGRFTVTPLKSPIADRAALVETYLGGTVLARAFAGTVPFTIPTRTRFEHHHIVAGSGHGKTQTLQYLIANDLDAVARGEASVVVLDSQGDLLKAISQLKVFAPGEPLHDRVCIIDPTDVEYPVSLNLFDVGIERLQAYPMLERERLTNSILELYDFVLGSLLSAEMTQKQTVVFRYVTRLMLHIPDATIHTLRELMEPGSEKAFAPHIAKLTGTARQFFETEFASREFADTKKQVLRRLWGILENQTFERMFSHPRSKLDLFAEMNAGKVILINTAKDLLKETGTEIFGRFFIALIAQAAQERAVLREADRMPTFVYIDEAADYFDRNIGLILSQARKFNVGMVLAHQYLGQLDPKLQEAFAANTAIKFAGGVSNKDARALAPMLGSAPEFIESQPKGSFAASIRGLTASALPLQFPLGYLEGLPSMTTSDRAELQSTMRRRYAVHISELQGGAAARASADRVEPPAPSTHARPDDPPHDPDHPDIDPSPTL